MSSRPPRKTSGKPTKPKEAVDGQVNEQLKPSETSKYRQSLETPTTDSSNSLLFNQMKPLSPNPSNDNTKHNQSLLKTPTKADDVGNSSFLKRVHSPCTTPSPSKYQKFSSPNKTADLHGYIVSISQSNASTGNEFIDIRLKISETETVLIKVMKKHNRSVTIETLRPWQSSGRPVAFLNVSPGHSGTYFFNSYKDSKIEYTENVGFSFDPTICGTNTIKNIKTQSGGFFDVKGCLKYLEELKDVDPDAPIKREAVLYDDTDVISITLWGVEHRSLPEDKWISLSNVVLKFYYGKHIATSRGTIVEVLENENLDIPSMNKTAFLEYESRFAEINKELTVTLSHPNIVTATVEYQTLCQSCQSVVAVIPGKKVVTCLNCGKGQKACSISRKLNCSIDINNNSYSIPSNVLMKTFGDNIITECETEEGKSNLVERILFGSFDVTHDNKYVVKSLKEY